MVKYGIVNYILQGDTNAVADIIQNKGIVTSKGNVLDVLVKRRKREADLFKSDSIQPSTTPVVPPTPTTTESTTTTKPTTNDNTNSDETDSYIQRTYEKEYGPLDANITKYKQKLYPHLYGNKGIMLTREKLKGERNLIQELEKLKAKRNTQIKNATKNLTPFT